jgi:transposase InsO family protein
MARCPLTNTDSPAPQVLSSPSVPLKDTSMTPGEPQRTLRSDSIELWHRRVAHLNSSAMKKLLAATVQYSEDHDTALCDICIRAKHQQKFQRTKVPSSSVPFELIHSDLCGPIKHPSLGGATYYIVYVDDCTKHTALYFLVGKSSDEITAKFDHHHAWVRAQGYRIKRFRCDNGCGEFSNKKFLDTLGTHGISYELAPLYTQHKNGTAERMIRTINTKARCMLLDSNLPMRFWANAVHTACYLYQRTLNSSLPNHISPFEALIGTKSKVHHLRHFGCTVYKWIPKEQRSNKNFGPRSKPCMFLGYVHKITKVGRLWDFEQKKAVECSNVVWREDQNALEANIDDAEAFLRRFEEDICFPTDEEGPDESADEDPSSALMSTGETISMYIPTG